MQTQRAVADEVVMVTTREVAVTAPAAWWRDPEPPTIIGSLDSQAAVIEAELKRWRKANARLRATLHAIDIIDDGWRPTMCQH